jgi:hypothetical protein
MASPQRAHEGPDWTENCDQQSDQQRGQIGTEESCGRGEPQRAQEDGSKAQLKLSIGLRSMRAGLRSTRTTARQRVVWASGTSDLRMAESVWKTHLASGNAGPMQPDGESIAQLDFRPPFQALGDEQVKESGGAE